MLAVGKPIRVAQNVNPSREEIDVLHARYLQELRELYDEHRDKMDPESRMTFVK